MIPRAMVAADTENAAWGILEGSVGIMPCEVGRDPWFRFGLGDSGKYCRPYSTSVQPVCRVCKY